MVVKPRVYGRIHISREGGSVTIKVDVEVCNAVFKTPKDIVNAVDECKNVSYVTKTSLGLYNPPVASPLPTPLPSQYQLVDFSISYTIDDPRLNIIQSPKAGSTVLTKTRYVIVDDFCYSHLAVIRDDEGFYATHHPILWAYPLKPGKEPFNTLIEEEFRFLRMGVKHPHLIAAMVTCLNTSCNVLEDLWRKRVGHERLKLIACEWLERDFGIRVEPSKVGVVNLVEKQDLLEAVVEDGSIGVVRIKYEVGEEKRFISEEVVIHGKRLWKPLGRLKSYTSLCPYCLHS